MASGSGKYSKLNAAKKKLKSQLGRRATKAELRAELSGGRNKSKPAAF